MRRFSFLVLILILCESFPMLSQELKVTLSEDKKKVLRDFSNGISAVVFETPLKDLTIINEWDDERITLDDNQTLFLIQPVPDSTAIELGYPKRGFLLKTPHTGEYLLETDEIFPNTVLHYTVVIPNRFPLTLSAEYLFSQSAKYGVRLSVGTQFGAYLSYKWGDYRPSGNNIDKVNIDSDLSNTKKLGYIRTSITAGARVGLIYKEHRNHMGNAIYILIGGGYGEYGRQWENPIQIAGNKYFYSDYIKGFDGELAAQFMLFDWCTMSVGADMLIGKGRVSVDYMLGIGLNLNLTKLRKNKHSKL